MRPSVSGNYVRLTGNDLGLDPGKSRDELLLELIDRMGPEPGGFVWMHQEPCRTQAGPCTCVLTLVTTQTLMLQ